MSAAEERAAVVAYLKTRRDAAARLAQHGFPFDAAERAAVRRVELDVLVGDLMAGLHVPDDAAEGLA